MKVVVVEIIFVERKINMFQTCQECGKKGFADLRAHLRKHKMTWQEYENKYNETPRSQNTIYQIPEHEKLINNYERQLVSRLKDVR